MTFFYILLILGIISSFLFGSARWVYKTKEEKKNYRLFLLVLLFAHSLLFTVVDWRIFEDETPRTFSGFFTSFISSLILFLFFFLVGRLLSRKKKPVPFNFDKKLFSSSPTDTKPVCERDFGDGWILEIYKTRWVLKYSHFIIPTKSDGTMDMRYNGHTIHKEFTPEDVRSILTVYEQMKNDFLLLKTHLNTSDTEYKYYENGDSIRYSYNHCTYRISGFVESEFYDENGLKREPAFEKMRCALRDGDELVEKYRHQKTHAQKGAGK